MRLIDADVLRTSIETDRDASDMPKMWYEGIAYAINHIIHAPTADVPERNVVKWKLNKDGNWACPFCEFDPYHDNMKGMNYCPNCGARLEGYDGRFD